MERMPLILIDTTALYSGLVYNGLENKVLRSGKYVFVTTEHNMLEIYRILVSERMISREEAVRLVRSVPIVVVKRGFYNDRIEDAKKLIGFRVSLRVRMPPV